MCGFVGILRHADPAPDPERVKSMLGFVRHRGPDASSLYHDRHCALGHARLAVIDPAAGPQPMTAAPLGAEHGELVVVFNGEIYNHRPLRRELEAKGHRFSTDHCDTEVLLHGYREWGTALPERLEGMFAFAVRDPNRGELFLARDRMGKKPLFFHRGDATVTFASEIGAVLVGLNHRPEVDTTALARFLTFGYTGRASLLSGVEELPPAHWLRLTDNGRTETRAYWHPPAADPSASAEGLDDTIARAVTARLDADVPLGCFLSGGIDSSLVAALAQRALGDRRLMTFSVSMPDAAYDEGPWAQRVADHIGAEHQELHAHVRIEDDLPRLIAVMGEPFADSSILPTYWVSRAARDHVTVALSGDGGDELFGGYDRYRALGMIARHRSWLARLPVGWLPRRGAKSHLTRVRRLVDAARQPDAARQYLDMVRLFDRQTLAGLGVDPGLAIDAPPDWPGDADPAEAARRWDLAHYLPGDLLRKVDRASMAIALEVRSPFLGREVVEHACRLPMRVLCADGPKSLLRRIASPHLPPEIIRRPKMGFAVPIGGWLAGPLRPWLSERLLDGRLREVLPIDRAPMERMIAEHAAGRTDHTHRLFALLTVAIWQAWRRDPTPGF